jgi:hypothetical protein
MFELLNGTTSTTLRIELENGFQVSLTFRGVEQLVRPTAEGIGCTFMNVAAFRGTTPESFEQRYPNGKDGTFTTPEELVKFIDEISKEP